MIRRHSPIAHAAYADLVASLKDEAVADLRGTPTRVARNGKVYWYDTFRVGSDVRKAYIGEDNDEIRARLARHAELAARRAEAQAVAGANHPHPARGRVPRRRRGDRRASQRLRPGRRLPARRHDRRHAGLPPLRRRTRPALRIRPDRANQRHRHRQLRAPVARARRRGVAAAAIHPEGFFFRTRAAASTHRSLAMAPDAWRSPGRVPDAELRRGRRRAAAGGAQGAGASAASSEFPDRRSDRRRRALSPRRAACRFRAPSGSRFTN